MLNSFAASNCELPAVPHRCEHRWVDGVNGLMPGEPHTVDDTQHS
jgi:hypothetical protein